MTLRTLQKSDLPQLMAIERAVHIAPWSEETFQTCFDSHCLGIVMEENARVVGFLVASVHTGECHILNICVATTHQRQGIGKELMIEALARAKFQGAGIVYLEVRRSNTRAISLYRKLEFHLVGERKAYYPSGEGFEDALVFAKSLHVVIP